MTRRARRTPMRRRITVDGVDYWLRPGGTVSRENGSYLGRIEKAPARGQRISRQPWKASVPHPTNWRKGARQPLGVHATRVDAIRALIAHADARDR